MGNKKHIWWTTANRIGDRFVLYMNGEIVGNYLTLNECWNLYQAISKETK